MLKKIKISNGAALVFLVGAFVFLEYLVLRHMAEQILLLLVIREMRFM